MSAWGHSHGLPVLITNCSNDYGSWQFPEKLIPLTIGKALSGAALPAYGSGLQVRDWPQVDDHVRALTRVFDRGRPGQHYVIGGEAGRRNIDVVHAICSILDRLAPRADGRGHACAIAPATIIAMQSMPPGSGASWAGNRRIRLSTGWRRRDIPNGP